VRTEAGASTPVFIGGHPAGGGLALATMLKLRDENAARRRGAVLTADRSRGHRRIPPHQRPALPCILVRGSGILNVLELTALVGLVSVAAGFLGALTGLGGGVVITPAMVLLLGIDLHYAMGAALISVIATSSGAAAAYVREGFSNIRIGMFLEIATTVGAVCGAFAAAKISPSILGVLFGACCCIPPGSPPAPAPRRAPERRTIRWPPACG
jgi:hypothetical protein